MNLRTGSEMHAIRAQCCHFQTTGRTDHELAALCTPSVHNAANSRMDGG